MHRMLLRSQKVLMATAAAAGLWFTAGSATAQLQQPAGQPGSEWFREGAGNVQAGIPAGGIPVGLPAGMPAAAAPVAGVPAAGVPAGVPAAVPTAAPADPSMFAPATVPAAPPAAAPANPAAPQLPAGNRPFRMPPIPSNNSNPYGSVGGLYPSAEMNAYAAAMARAATARALFHLADSELSQAYRAAQKAFDNSAEYRQALREEKDAYENLNGARAKALSTLSSDDKYQRLAALRQDLTERLDDLRSRRGMSQQEIIAMANLKMSYSTEMRSFETVALNNEPAVKQAQDRLVAAGQHVSELRQRYSDSLRVNPEILVARRNLDDARIAKLTAEAYLHAAMTNGSYALDYAYYLYRRPSNNYYGGGYYGGDYSYTGGNYRY